MLIHIPELLSPIELLECRTLLEQGQWAPGELTAGTQSTQVKNNLQLPELDPHAQAARACIMQALGRNATFFTAALPKKIFPLMFNRYGGATNAFGNHIDNAVRTPLTGGPWVRTDVSATLFLTDPAIYEGGELIIEDLYGAQSVKLAAGDLVLYPSSSVHRVEPVTRGERWACFFWIESMVRSTDQRRLLYDLDQSIIALRAEGGDSPPVVRLTGIYHNLLRQWAEV